ncbi:MAG: MoaD/ThiS family protein [Nitrososphaerota archaeon]|nr:MoaD/ThiS family protein [Candidatus Bathyarchaeota archaeon]MDW8023208.1 MoaD/ThiS family protein [Nitrososphaerota archaeon]
MGYIGDFLGKSAEYVELPEGASLKFFLNFLLNLHGEKLEREIYDAEGHCLKRGFSILVNNNLVLGGTPIPEIPLREGDHVIISPLIAGG